MTAIDSYLKALQMTLHDANILEQKYKKEGTKRRNVTVSIQTYMCVN